MSYANAYVIRRPASFTVDDVEMKDQVSKVRLVPDTPVQVMRTWGGVDKDRDETSWTCEITMHESYMTGGLALALWTAAESNTPIELVITPRTGTGQKIMTVSAIPVPTGFGGEAGTWSSAEVTLECIDQPVLGTVGA